MDELPVEGFLNQVVESLRLKAFEVLKTEHNRDRGRVRFQPATKFIKKSGLPALPGGKYGEVPAQVNHGLDVLVVHIGYIFQMDAIGRRRINNP